ncbi:MAG TPA: SH3 domain-containing protein, partial [Patescibacteria group bacterium]
MFAAAYAQSDFQKGQAKTTASKLIVRNIAAQGGTEIGTLSRGEIVDVIDRSPSTSQIDELTDYWYKIQFDDAKKKKQTGWVFGGYLTFELNMENGLRWKTVSPSGGQALKAIAVSDSGD